MYFYCLFGSDYNKSWKNGLGIGKSSSLSLTHTHTHIHAHTTADSFPFGTLCEVPDRMFVLNKVQNIASFYRES